MEILITGGANGIGKATVEKLVSEHSVKVFDIDEKGLQQLPENAETFQGDVSDEERVKQVLEQLDLDVLVNCAGYYELGSIEDVESEDVMKQYDANVFGPLNFSRHATEMIRENSGRIINVASVAGRLTPPFFGIYSSTKHALEAISDAQRMELKEFDVDVVVIEPGPIETGFNRRAREELEKYIPGSDYSDKYSKILENETEGKTAEQAAEKIVKAIETDNPRARYQIGWQAWLGPKLKAVLPTFLTDRILSDY